MFSLSSDPFLRNLTSKPISALLNWDTEPKTEIKAPHKNTGAIKAPITIEDIFSNDCSSPELMLESSPVLDKVYRPDSKTKVIFVNRVF